MIQIIASSILAILAGLLHGGREAQHAQPNVFEQRFGLSATSFFGSLSWLRKYEDLDGTKPIRRFYTSFSDYWHVAAWLQKLCIIAAMLIVVYQLPWWVAGLGIAALESMAASVAYKYLRYKRIV